MTVLQKPGVLADLRASPIARLLVRRIFLGLLTLFFVSVVVFAATQLLPGDAARAVLGRTATPVSLAALRDQLHLDQPVVEQYWLWLSGVLTGHPGTSLANRQPVWDFVAPRIVNSAFLMLVVAIIGVPLSIGFGISAALRRNRAFDHAVSTGALTLAAMPEFVLGNALVVLLATVVIRLLPPVSLVAPGSYPWSDLSIVILPALTLLLAVFPYIFRMMRASMIEVLQSEYVEMARLNGLPAWTLILRYALPNAIAPTVQVVALTFAYLAGGVVVVEFVFAYPGIGQGLINAVTNRDIPVVQFIVLLLGGFYVAVNIVADVIAVLVTPRLRTGSWRRS